MWDKLKDDVYLTASSLLQHFVSDQRSKLIYRGLGYHQHTLTPSIVRAKISRKLEAIYGGDSQTFKELTYLHWFVTACDDAGLQVAGDSNELRNFLKEPTGQNSQGRNVDLFKFPSLWPTDQDSVFRFLAQAQHHGVPTRLLDWTSFPLVACYFAVSQALNERAKQGDQADLSNWMVSIVELDCNAAGSFEDTFRIRKAPGSTSKNLAAQKGMFTFIKGFGLDSLDINNHELSRTYLKRHLLPLSEAKALMQHLERLGVTIATLFPGYDGAGKHATEAMMLDDLDQEIRNGIEPQG